MTKYPMTNDHKERPILFSGPMVKAILEGQKTQTRRVAKTPLFNAKAFRVKNGVLQAMVTSRERERLGIPEVSTFGGWINVVEGSGEFASCPYGKPGDRLWVRETFAIECNSGLQDAYSEPDRPLGPVRWLTEDDEWETPFFECPRYKASEPDTLLVYENDFDDEPTMRWRPSIHMPRWASRITLEVTDVRVERVQEISEEDAIAEGISIAKSEDGMSGYGDDATLHRFPQYTKRYGFGHLWDSINGKKHPWASNPWVWVVSFKRVKA